MWYLSRVNYQVVRIQMLAELEEIILFKQSESSEKRHVFLKSWNRRLKGCQRNVEVWQRVLKIRALVIPPKEDKEIWITFGNLCRKSSRMGLASKTFKNLLDHPVADFASPELLRNDPHVAYACLKHLWVSGNHVKAFEQLRDLTKMMSDSLGITKMTDIATLSDASSTLNAMMPLLARCYLKIGDWQVAQQDGWTEEAIPQILNSYLAAKTCDRNFYKAHHAWATANFAVLNYYEHSSESAGPQLLLKHTIDSLQGMILFSLCKDSFAQSPCHGIVPCKIPFAC